MWEERFRDLSDTAGRQQGLITARQAARSGVTAETLDHFKRSGLLIELDWSVYQLVGSPLGPRYAYPFAAWLSLQPDLYRWERLEAGPDAVLSHESACNLHGIGSLPASLEVFTTTELRPAPRGIKIHVSPLAVADTTISMDIPVTTPGRTIVDLVRDWTDHEAIGRVITDAVQRDQVDLLAVHDDLVPLAAEHGFPAGSRQLIEYFAPDLSPASLSVRNLRAYARLVFPDRVSELRRRLVPLLDDEGGARYERLSLDVAAEIVARTERRG